MLQRLHTTPQPHRSSSPWGNLSTRCSTNGSQRSSAARPQQGLNVRVPRLYQTFLSKLCGRFPHERQGIQAFYNECWRVFHALNSIELRSLEEPRYLMQQFIKSPLSCLKLASCLTSNTGESVCHLAQSQLEGRRGDGLPG